VRASPLGLALAAPGLCGPAARTSGLSGARPACAGTARVASIRAAIAVRIAVGASLALAAIALTA